MNLYGSGETYDSGTTIQGNCLVFISKIQRNSGNSFSERFASILPEVSKFINQQT